MSTIKVNIKFILGKEYDNFKQGLIEMPANINVRQMLSMYDLSPAIVIVAINGNSVAANTLINDGDQIIVVPEIAGG